jgi:uncharacterized cupin superfamily protein
MNLFEANPQPAKAAGNALACDGFAGPVRIFTRDQCALIVRHALRSGRRPPADWRKGLATVDRFFFDLGTRPQILALVRDAIGEDVLFWGVDFLTRIPGQVHTWHTDIESAGGDKFVSVWIGLENTTRETSLLMVPGSHRYGKPIQQVAHENGRKRQEVTQQDILAWSRCFDPEAEIVQPAVEDGEALVFDGRLWHASKNVTQGKTRRALLLQYAAADQTLRKPDFDQLEWPFRYHAAPLPAILVSGSTDGKQHKLVPPPQIDKKAADDAGIVCRPLQFPLADDPERGWRPHRIMNGRTPNADAMSAHISVLSPGFSPHPPHVHVEEEVLVVLDGEAEILIGENTNPDEAVVHRVSAGAFSYYPAYQHHTIRNSGAKPVTYLMFKWRGPPQETSNQAKTGIFRFSDVLLNPEKKYHTEKFVEQPTGYLKRLHAHMTSLEPGAGYEPHADKHDVAIVVLEGTVRSAGTSLSPHGVFYFPAGTMHGMKNVGQARARYLVFEFHSPEPKFKKGELAFYKTGTKKKSAIRRALKGSWRWIASPVTRMIDHAVDRRLRMYFSKEELRSARARMKKREGR